MNDNDNKRLEVERALGYRFRHPGLFQIAMTSQAWANEQRQVNRACDDWKDLEWLGDAVIYLAATLSKLGEGTERRKRTPERVNLVSNAALADLGRRLGLREALLLTCGDHKNIEKDGDQTFMAQATEALFGALFLDLRRQGLPAWDYVQLILSAHLQDRPFNALVPGSPAPGESDGERAWRERVRDDVDGFGPGPAELAMALIVERGCTPDLDNLSRPVLDALRDAGWYSKGFPELQRLRVVRAHGPNTGVALRASRERLVIEDVQFDATFESPPPSDRTGDWIGSWAGEVRRQAPASTEGVKVSIEVRSDRSLKDLMKPIIDGLEPWLGRDPAGRSRFAPRDERIEALEICRVESGPAVRVWGGV